MHFILFSRLRGLQVGLPHCVVAEAVPSLFLPESLPQCPAHSRYSLSKTNGQQLGRHTSTPRPFSFLPPLSFLSSLELVRFFTLLKPFLLSTFLISSMRSLHRAWGGGPHFTPRSHSGSGLVWGSPCFSPNQNIRVLPGKWYPMPTHSFSKALLRMGGGKEAK